MEDLIEVLIVVVWLVIQAIATINKKAKKAQEARQAQQATEHEEYSPLPPAPKRLHPPPRAPSQRPRSPQQPAAPQTRPPAKPAMAPTGQRPVPARQPRPQPPVTAPARPVPSPAATGGPGPVIHPALMQAKSELDQISIRLSALSAKTTAAQGNAVLAGAISRVSSAVNAVRTELTDTISHSISDQDQYLGRGQLFPLLARFRQQTDYLVQAAESTLAPAAAATLAKGQALAEALAKDIQDALHAGGIRVPLNPPLCLAARSNSAVRRALTAAGITPVFLPPNLIGRPHIWGAFGHEFGHALLAQLPGFEEEVQRAARLDPNHLAEDRDPVYALFYYWIEEMIVDIFAAQLLGPAYGINFTQLFAQPQNPRGTFKVQPGSHGIDVHPPSGIRLKVISEALLNLGFEIAADELAQVWEERHGTVEEAVISFRTGQRATLPSAILLDAAGRFFESVALTGLSSLNGRSIANIPSFNMTLAAHGEAVNLAGKLQQGLSITESVRRLLPAVLLACNAVDGEQPAVRAAIEQSITDFAGRQSVRGPAVAAVSSAATVARPLLGHYTAEEFRDALLLSEILISSVD